ARAVGTYTREAGGRRLRRSVEIGCPRVWKYSARRVRPGRCNVMKPESKEVQSVLVLFLTLLVPILGHSQALTAEQNRPAVIKIEEGFVDVQGVLIYYKQFGSGPPLMVLHGGPGASHDYFLPHFLPLARNNRLVFIDERGSGKSAKLENPSLYTVENMIDDAEAVRTALHLGKISLLGHSCGGVL